VRDHAHDLIPVTELPTTSAYIFWSILTSLIPTLFYFSIWELGIAGHELALLSTLSPAVLGFSPILTWTETRSGRSSLQFMSFSALAAYAFHSPLVRLFMVSFGSICAVLRQVMDWTGIDGNGAEYHGVCESLATMFLARSCISHMMQYSVGNRSSIISPDKTCQSLEQSRCVTATLLKPGHVI
jgi:hypothetical protein